MKSQKLKMIINVIIICLFFLMLFSTKIQAKENIDSWIQEANDFVSKGQKNNVISTSAIKDVVIPIGQALVAIGTVVLVVVTIIMGIKYMACGSPEEKAKLKTQLIGLVVSTIVIFGAQAIWALIYNFMINVT